jgi:subtilase family serine protease
MSRSSRFTALATAGACAASFALIGAQAAAAKTVVLKGSSPPAARTTARVASVPARSPISFEVVLSLRDARGAAAFARSVSTPGSPAYGRFLRSAQWVARFSPTAGQVAEVKRFLISSGFRVTGVPADRTAVDAVGSAGRVEGVFKTSLSYHLVSGRKLRVADRDLSIPAALRPVVAGVAGVTESVTRPASEPGPSPAPPPSGLRPAPPCGTYFGEKLDTTLPPFGNGYPPSPPWAICGYTPPQFRSAYNLTGRANGSGVTVAVVDAYASPTLIPDARKYAALNDPSNPLGESQIAELFPSGYNHSDVCGASGWYTEQMIDVEAVHATAPGAHILYAGGPNCSTLQLVVQTVRKVVDGHLAQIVTNSYGEPAGDRLEDPAVHAAEDNVLTTAAGTGISVLFSSGDAGDNFTAKGVVAPEAPASSPWATAVGGTTLAIGSQGQRLAEWGWSTARSRLCNDALVKAGGCTDAQLNQWLPLSFTSGAGGGTSSFYHQPDYQKGIVPASLSYRDGEPMRVIPDISMDADPATGFLIGYTQKFPNGTYYDQTRFGGTSLASPLLAGVIARADQTAGRSLGFVNPLLYSLYGKSGALYDALPATHVDMSRADYANSVTPNDGFLYTTRIVDYEGQEQFCDANGNCRTRDITLHVGPGYDNMTGLGSPGADFVGDLAAAASH